MFTFVNHSLHRQKVSLCRSLCKITISILATYLYLHRLHSKKGLKHYSGENSIYHYITNCKNYYIRNESL
nr:MAG TPA: hypothetical protein [Caudoviricetes sp.]